MRGRIKIQEFTHLLALVSDNSIGPVKGFGERR
jgi:hypothetical protein